MATFDLIVLGLLLFGGLAGFRKGLISGVSKFAGKIAAIGIAVVFHKQFLNALEPIFGLRQRIEPKIAEFLTKLVESRTGSNSYGDSGLLVQPVVGEATVVLTDYVLKIGALLLLFIIVTIAVNIVINLVINPLAQTLSVVDRGGGLAFGILGTLVGLCLAVGLVAPFIISANTGIAMINDSFLYPWLMQGYDIILAAISAFAGDILVNPFEAFPLLQETII